MSAPSAVGTPAQYAAFASGLTKATPVVATIGDVHYAWIVVSTASTITTPAGWTQLGTGTFNAGAQQWGLYTKVSTATGSESPTWTFTGGGTAELQYALYTTHVIDVQGTIATATGGSTADATAISPASSATRLLFFAGLSIGRTFTTPAGMTAVSSNLTTVRLHVAEQVLSASGSTGARSAALSGVAATAAIMLALNVPARSLQMVV